MSTEQYHGTIIQTGITCKKIPLYARRIAEISRKYEIQNLDWFMQTSFHQSSNRISLLKK